MTRITADTINNAMDASLDYIGENQWCLGDLPEAPTWCFHEQYILDFVNEMIDYADSCGASPSTGDFRDVWFDDYVQELLRLMLTKNTSQRLVAVWVRDTLNLDPIRTDIVRKIWSHL